MRIARLPGVMGMWIGLLFVGLYLDHRKILPLPAAWQVAAGEGLVQQAPSGIFRCNVNGRTLYQAEPCDDPATAAEISGGSFNVVDPHKVPPASATGRSTQPPRRVGRAVDEAEALALKKQKDCNRHQLAIKRIDAQARVRSTARLAEKRRHHKDSLWALSCGFP